MKTKNTDKTPEELRESLLMAALEHVAFDGWSLKTMKQAAEQVDVKTGIIDLSFPGGPSEMVDLWAQSCDLAMLASVQKIDIEALKIREKITALVKLRIEAEFAHKEAAHRTVSFLTLPQNHTLSLKMLYRTVDLMWKTISDPSTDFNFYTKRMTLGLVYSSCFMFWLGDESENSADTWDFLDRRIENVMQFEKVKAKWRNQDLNLPNIWRELGKKKYGS